MFRVDKSALQHRRYFRTDRIKQFVAQDRRKSYVANLHFFIYHLRRIHWRIVTGRGTSVNSVFPCPCLRVGDCTAYVRWRGLLFHNLGLDRRWFGTSCVSYYFNDLLHLLPLHHRCPVHTIRNYMASGTHVCPQCLERSQTFLLSFRRNVRKRGFWCGRWDVHYGPSIVLHAHWYPLLVSQLLDKKSWVQLLIRECVHLLHALSMPINL